MLFYKNWNKPWIIGVIYLINIILFSIVYWIFLPSSFKSVSDLTFIQAFYFSIVTVTTLGYGDIIPDLNSNPLLICIIFQVILGVLNIGLFLNAISNKISLNKEKEIYEQAEKLKNLQTAKILTILRPIVIRQLETLSDIYKSTSKDDSNREFYISPKKLMNDAYFDQVCLIDYFSLQTKSGNKNIYAEVLIQDNDEFQKNLDNFLVKFSHALEINIISLINEIQNHKYFDYPKFAKQLYPIYKKGCMENRHLISLEHSKRISSNFDMPRNMRDYHSKLLTLIDFIDEYLPDDKIQMKIYLRDMIIPPVGSAIAKVFVWGSEKPIEIDKLFNSEI